MKKIPNKLTLKETGIMASLLKKSLRSILAFVLLLCIASPVSAQQQQSSLLEPPTSSKTIFFLFHKISGRHPSFDQAIQSTKLYKESSPQSQTVLMADQKNRLQLEFASSDPNAIIIVRSAVEMKADIIRSPGLHASLPGAEPGSNGSIYFPYNWGGMNIALIPNQIEPFMDIPLDLQTASALASKITNGMATLVLEMQPLSADGKSSMMLDGIPQWLLMTKIVGVTYYNDNLQVIWSWTDSSLKRGGASKLEELKK